MKIFVTGGTGFVGKAVLEALLAEGHRLSCLVRNPEKTGRHLPGGVEWIKGDLLKPAEWRRGLEGCEAAIHLVGIIRETRRETFQLVHVEGTRNIVEAARGAGIRRFLQMSALGSRPGAKSRYHQTKFMAEELVKGAGLEYTVIRPSVIFGPEDRFVNVLAALIRWSPVILIPGRGTTRLQPVALGDVVFSMVQALKKPQSIGKTYELGGPEALGFEELVDRLMAVMRRPRLKVHVPMTLMSVAAQLFEKFLPVPPLTRDQLIMLQEDNTCRVDEIVSDLGISLQGFSEGVSGFLS